MSNVRLSIQTLEQKLQEVEEEDFIQSCGFYKSKYDFGSSDDYKLRLDEIREQQKQMIKAEAAVICRTTWSVGGSEKEGQKMTRNFIRLVLRAFNGECDSAIMKVKYNNINSLEKRINKAYDALNKLSSTTHCEITKDFLSLKLQELYLTHEFQEKKQEEREEQRLIREEMREEERARKEADKQRKKAEQEEKAYAEALQKAREELALAEGEVRSELEKKLADLQRQLDEAHTNTERAISQAQMTKSGHVYIISNIGSFGKNVYKIGMTRRLEPLDRVKELGDASVPFSFDVHAMIFAENAPELESDLHRYFDDRRLNKVNTRKEFFRVSLDEIAKAAQEIAIAKGIEPHRIRITKMAEAEEYRKTLALEKSLERQSNS